MQKNIVWEENMLIYTYQVRICTGSYGTGTVTLAELGTQNSNLN